MKGKRLVGGMVVAALLLGTGSLALAMRCGSKVVSIGDSKGEVAAKCGEPTFSEVVAAVTDRSAGEGAVGEITETIEHWSYRQESGSLLKTLYFRGDRLERIEDGDRIEGPGALRTTTFIPEPGATQAEILQQYGEPLRRDLVGIVRLESAGGAGIKEEKVERWTYDLGPGRFLKLLTFEGGLLIRVEDGERR